MGASSFPAPVCHADIAGLVCTDHVATILHQCRGDDGAPCATTAHVPRPLLLAEQPVLSVLTEDTFTREWALFAVRNMCEISSEAQAAIRCARESDVSITIVGSSQLLTPAKIA